MNYIPYYRVSTKAQERSGLGLEAQENCVKGFVRANNGTILSEYTEVESRRSMDRLELKRALRECKLTGSKLIIAKLCRLSRDVHFLTGLMKSGVDFVCCDMPDANSMTVQLMAVLAESEAKNISIRTKEALAAAKRRGVKLGNPNLDKVRNNDTSKANAVRLSNANEYSEYVYEVIEELYLEEGVSTYRGIATMLNARGVKTRRGCKWTPVQVSRVVMRLAVNKGEK